MASINVNLGMQYQTISDANASADADRNAILCTALPSNFLWSQPSAHIAAPCSAPNRTDARGALQQFYTRDLIASGEPVNFHLPDLVAFRIQGMAAVG